MALRRKGKCLACQRKAATRGLCEACYQVAHYKMRTKQVTEQEMIDAGAILPAYATARSPFSNLLQRALVSRRKRKCDARSA